MLPRNKRERRQSGGKIVVGDGRNLPVLSGQSGRSTKEWHDDIPAVSKRPSVYGSSPIMTVTASGYQGVLSRRTVESTYSCRRRWGRIQKETYS